MSGNLNLKQKSDTLNAWIEDVANWIIILEGKEFHPKHKNSAEYYGFTHENLVVAARVEMYGFGRIYKKVILTSHEYELTEIPEDRWHTVWTAFYNPVGEDASNPSEMETVDNQIITRAKWWPPDDYVKELVEKRNFMTAPEFDIWAKVIDKVHEAGGAKTPNYIKRKPFAQVH